MADSLEADRMTNINKVLASIKPDEDRRADSVFKNLKIMRGVRARVLVSTVMYNWSHALGVSCNHCHDTNDWAADTKIQKDIARSMVGIQSKIHRTILDSVIMHYENHTPHLSCLSCHHGQAIPEY